MKLNKIFLTIFRVEISVLIRDILEILDLNILYNNYKINKIFPPFIIILSLRKRIYLARIILARGQMHSQKMNYSLSRHHLNNSIGRTLMGQWFARDDLSPFYSNINHDPRNTSYLSRANATAYFMFPHGIKGRANSLVDTLLPLRSSWINVSGKCIHPTAFSMSMTSGHANSWSVVYPASSSANANRYPCYRKRNASGITFLLKENCVIFNDTGYKRIESTLGIIPIQCCWKNWKLIRAYSEILI